MITIKTLLLAALLGLALSGAFSPEVKPAAPTGCSTDTECSLLCPINDAQCDGGPQS